MLAVTSPCNLCNGSGWVTDPETRTARICGCANDTRKAQRISAAAIPKRYLHCTLDEFQVEEKSDRKGSLHNARKLAVEMVDLWPSVRRGLLFAGPPGVGKTHLAVAILQEIVRCSKPGRLFYSNVPDLIQNIQSSFQPDTSRTKEAILEPLLGADLLVLDELGAQKPTAFVQDTLYYVINSRYNSEQVTIFTTNYLDSSTRPTESPEADNGLEHRIGHRLRSRLFEMAFLVPMTGDDYRKKLKENRF